MDEATNNVTPIRNTKGQFQRGVSGNPSGKSKYSPREVSEYLESRAISVARKLVELITAHDTPASARVSAIKEFNERLYGKAPNQTVVRVAETEGEFDTGQLSKDALREIAKLAGNAGSA